MFPVAYLPPRLIVSWTQTFGMLSMRAVHGFDLSLVSHTAILLFYLFDGDALVHFVDATVSTSSLQSGKTRASSSICGTKALSRSSGGLCISPSILPRRSRKSRAVHRMVWLDRDTMWMPGGLHEGLRGMHAVSALGRQAPQVSTSREEDVSGEWRAFKRFVRRSNCRLRSLGRGVRFGWGVIVRRG